MARQPIYDRRLKIHAYELLFRCAPGDEAGIVGTAESAAALTRALVEIGLESLAPERPAYIKIPIELMGNPALQLVQSNRFVLEVLRGVDMTPELIESAKDLARKGYKLVLSDQVFMQFQEEFQPFCKIVKVDVLKRSWEEMPLLLAALKQARVRVIAEKVETMDAYVRCQALGFDYFEGYFFARPATVSSKAIPQSRAILIHLLTRLQDTMVGIDELEDLVSNDVSLTYRLLRLVNSAGEGLDDRVESVRSALMLLGIERVVALVSLLAMTGVDDKPGELMVTAMIRARMCETVATLQGHPNPEKFFTVGLLSVLEALFDMPMATLLEHLPLSHDIKSVLLGSEADTPIAKVLQSVLCFERGDWASISEDPKEASNLCSTYVGSVVWADQTTKALAA